MPRAHEIAAVILNPPPSGHVIYNASESTTRNREYEVILENTLHTFPHQDVQSFRAWLESVPFDFVEITQTTTGRVSESEGDVRLFFEPAVIVACWPIILAMAPTSRNYDLALRSEKTLKKRSRPDISILKLLRGENNNFTYNSISAVEFKAPGVFSRVCISGNINVNAGDDWDIVSSQIRKYAICNRIQNVVVVDDQWGIFIHFRNPSDISAVCNYMVAPVGAGTVTPNLPLTLRELFLFSVFQTLLVEVQIRNYGGITVSTSVLDYIEQFPGATPPPRENRSTIASSSLPTRRSTRIGSTTHVVLEYNENPLFPLCAITKFDITHCKTTEMTEGPAKRNVRPFFVSSNIISSLEMEIEEHNGRVMISPQSDSSHPTTSNLVLKHFPATDLVGAFQETTLYAALKPYQGLIIPFCYGIFDIDDIDGIGILLENVPGLTLAEFLANLTIETDQIRNLYLNCFYALHCMHSAGYAHRDIRAENIIVFSVEQVVLVDFENSKPAKESSKRLDKAALRMIFRRFGVDEAILRGWAT